VPNETGKGGLTLKGGESKGEEKPAPSFRLMGKGRGVGKTGRYLRSSGEVLESLKRPWGRKKIQRGLIKPRRWGVLGKKRGG